MRLCPHCMREDLRPFDQRALNPLHKGDYFGDQVCAVHGIVKPSDQETKWHFGVYLCRKAPGDKDNKTRFGMKWFYIVASFKRWRLVISAYRDIGRFDI